MDDAGATKDAITDWYLDMLVPHVAQGTPIQPIAFGGSSQHDPDNER
jgi:hypothetical protein